jgi:uncharacterized protein YaaW (UPF0174 family)
MRDEHLTPVLEACTEAELALLIEFLGRPPSGLMWLDRRVREPGHSHAERVAAVVEEILRFGNHSVAGRIGAGTPGWVQVVCDVLQNLELSEAPAPGILELEMRVVRFVLDTEFELLSPELQMHLLRGFHAGDFFVGGLRGYEPLHPFLTRVDADHRALGGAKMARAMRTVGLRELRKRAGKFVTKRALKVVLRRFAGPVQWMLTAWEWLGPAYRITVPVVCYVAFLRHAQAARRAEQAEPRAGDSDAGQALAAS